MEMLLMSRKERKLLVLWAGGKRTKLTVVRAAGVPGNTNARSAVPVRQCADDEIPLFGKKV
jgi:hypothetical protein